MRTFSKRKLVGLVHKAIMNRTTKQGCSGPGSITLLNSNSCTIVVYLQVVLVVVLECICAINETFNTNHYFLCLSAPCPPYWGL